MQVNVICTSWIVCSNLKISFTTVKKFLCVRQKIVYSNEFVSQNFHISWGQLYIYCITRFMDISRVFLQNTPQSTKQPLHIHFSYFTQISCLRKRKLWNPFDILWECCPWHKMMQNTKHEKNDTKYGKSAAKYSVMYFLFFTFREYFMLFREKCIASLTNYYLHIIHILYEFCWFVIYHCCLRIVCNGLKDVYLESRQITELTIKD